MPPAGAEALDAYSDLFSANFDLRQNSMGSIPDDLQGFDIDEFFGLEGTALDVESVLSQNKLQSSPLQIPEKSSYTPCSENSPGFSSDSGKGDSFISTDESSPSNEVEEFFSEISSSSPGSDSANHQLQPPPILSMPAPQPPTAYTIISDKSFDLSTLPEIAVPPAMNGCLILIPNTMQNDVTLVTANQSEQSYQVQMTGTEEEFEDIADEEEAEDDEDPLADVNCQVKYSGKQKSSLPSYVVVQNSGNCEKLTEEERCLLAKEGVTIPEDTPLTRQEERVLRKVRRRIRNKASAQLSRQKRKDYIKNLESRVKLCTDSNLQLQKKLANLEKQNTSLLQQLTDIQVAIGRKVPSAPNKATTGTCLMMMVLSCCFLMIPNADVKSSMSNQRPVSYESLMEKTSLNSRTLLSVSEPMAIQDGIKEEGTDGIYGTNGSLNVLKDESDKTVTIKPELDGIPAAVQNPGPSTKHIEENSRRPPKLSKADL